MLGKDVTLNRVFGFFIDKIIKVNKNMDYDEILRI